MEEILSLEPYFLNRLLQVLHLGHQVIERTISPCGLGPVVLALQVILIFPFIAEFSNADWDTPGSLTAE